MFLSLFPTDVAGYAHYHKAGSLEGTGAAQLIPVGEASRSITRRTNDSMVRLAIQIFRTTTTNANISSVYSVKSDDEDERKVDMRRNWHIK